MAREMKISGMDEISQMLSQCGERAEAIAAKALYNGAGTVADAVKAQMSKIKTGATTYREAYRKTGIRLPSVEEKEIVERYCQPGIKKFDKNGSEVSTSIGLKADGYAMLNGKMVPVAVIARSINSGTSFMDKQPFVKKGVNTVKKAVEAQISADIDAGMQSIINANENQ